MLDASATRSRLQATLAHNTPDAPMVDYIAERETDRRLREHLACRSEEELLDALGSESFYLPGRDISQNEGFLPYYQGPKLDMNESERVCPFGIRFTRGAYDSKFSVDHAVEGPLETASTQREILDRRWPSRTDFDYEPLLEIAERHADRALIGGFWSGILGDVVRMYGFERFLTDIALAPELVKTLIDRVTEVYLDLNDMIFSLLKRKLDIFFFGNDFGSQQGLLMSTDMWKEFYFDNVRKLCDLAHSYDLAVMMHSCGAVSELIDDLIEAGVDILDPVQTSAAGMGSDTLADRFGGRIVFHGGIDTQHVLPSATDQEVEEHVAHVVGAFSERGGYIASGSQLYGPDIPVERIITVYRTLGADV